MGLQGDITGLQARFEAGQDVGQQLAEALAEMVTRKGSKRLIWSWFGDLAETLKALGRYDELVQAADGVDPANLGPWDCQAAVEAWLAKQA
jgi:hypothetical protein